MTVFVNPSRRHTIGLLGETALASTWRPRRLRAADSADVIIVGAGLTAASWLEEEGCSTAIVEAQRPHRRALLHADRSSRPA